MSLRLPPPARLHIPRGEVQLRTLLAFGGGLLVALIVGYALWLYYAPTQKAISLVVEPEPTAQLPDGSAPEPTEDANALSVEWLDTPVRVDAQTLGFKALTPTGYALDDAQQLNNTYRVFHVGTVTTQPFGGRPLYLIQRACDGPCAGFQYRVIDYRGEQGLVLLTNLSNGLQEEDEGYFYRTSEYTIPDLRAPKTLIVERGGRRFTLEEEPFSPAVIASEYHPEPDDTYLDDLVHPVFGTIVEHVQEGLFYVTLPDQSLKVYRVQDPFHLQTAQSDSGPAVLTRGFRMTLPAALAAPDQEYVSNVYSPRGTYTFCPPYGYDVVDDVSGRVLPLGPDPQSNEQLYILADPNDPMYREVYDEVSHRVRVPSYEAYLESHPLLFWRNSAGRWVRFRLLLYYPSGEVSCGYVNSAL